MGLGVNQEQLSEPAGPLLLTTAGLSWEKVEVP